MLSKRLKFVKSLIANEKTVLDLGTDHGYIPVLLIKENRCEKVIASDISKNSLEKAVKLVNKNNLNSKISLRVGNGLDILEKDEANLILILGMGGYLISEILEKYNEKFEKVNPKFILNPMQNPRELRIYLIEKGFSILDEHIIEDKNKTYQIIQCAKNSSNTHQSYKNCINSNLVKSAYQHYINENNINDSKEFFEKFLPVYIDYGYINIQKKNFQTRKLIFYNLEKTKKLIEQMKNQANDLEKIKTLENKVKLLEEVYVSL